MKKIKISPQLQGIFWFCTVLVTLAVNFIIVFFLTGWIYRVTAITPAPLVMQLINSFGGLTLMVITVSLLTRAFRSKIAAGQMQMFAPIIDAMQRIAKGDFSVRVNEMLDERAPDRGSGIFVDLVKNVNQMALELDQMERMRQEFISNVSHEIQSPLTSIRGFAQALHNDQLSPDERKHYLGIIETESTRLSRITTNLLKLAALEAEHPKFEPKPYRLDRQIRALILANEPQWVEKAIEMDVALNDVEITADEDLLSQVWQNLLVNSIKFTPAQGKIGVHLCQEANTIYFKIEDTGAGISEEDQLHIFERFYKVDKSRTRTGTSGSGLGLSIARKIVEMHQGSISVTSQPGIGTTFTVALPAEWELTATETANPAGTPTAVPTTPTAPKTKSALRAAIQG